MYLDLLGMFSRDVAVFYGPYSLSDLRVIKLKHSKEKVFWSFISLTKYLKQLHI